MTNADPVDNQNPDIEAPADGSGTEPTTNPEPAAPAAQGAPKAPPSAAGSDYGADMHDVDHVGHQFDMTDRTTEENTNPLRAGLRMERIPAPCVMVIFGVTGDLTARKLMPSLYDLAVGHPLPEGFSIVGVSHRDWTDETFREEMNRAVKESARAPVTDESWDLFAKGLFYVRGDFDAPDVYTQLKERLDQVDEERRAQGNRLYYLATSPTFYGPIIKHLGESGLGKRQDI